MKCSLGISNFLEEISSLSQCSVFLYFFALIAEEGFLISPCYYLELCIQMDIYLSSSPLPLASLLFSVICKGSSDNHFAFWHFFFFGMILITASCTMSRTSIHSASGPLSIRSNPLNQLSLLHHKDLIPWFLVAYWAPNNLGVHLLVSYLFAFSYCSWCS